MIRRAPALLAAVAALFGCTGAPGTLRNEHYQREGDRQFLAEQYVQAAGHYDAFLTSNPDFPGRAEVRLKIGKCHLGSGRPEAAAAAFDRALADGPSPPLRWEILFRRAVAHRMLGDAPRALQVFRELAAAPAADRGRSVAGDDLAYETALALFRCGDWKAGQAELARVSPNGPKGREAQKRLGLAAFTVQVASFEDEVRARSEAGRVRGDVRAVPTDKPLYLVTVGSFTRYDDAQREAERLRRTHPQAFVIP